MIHELPSDAASGEVLRADPAVIAHAASEMVRLAQDIGDSRTLLPLMDVPEHAYGSSAAAPTVARAHQVSLGEVASTLDRLADVLGGDADRLYRIAFAVQEADRAAVARIGAARRWGGP